MNALKEAIIQLKQNSKEVYEEAVRILLKIVDNVLNEPSSLKLRSLQKSNQTLSKKVLNISGGLECLLTMGFAEKESTLILPPNVTPIHLKSFRDNFVQIYDELNSNAFVELLGNTSIDSSSSSCSSSNESDQGAIPKVSKDAATSETNFAKCHNAVPRDVSKENLPPLEYKNAAKPKINTNVSQAMVPHDIPKVNLPPIEYMFTNPFLRGIEASFHMALAYSDKELHNRALNLIPQTKLELNAQKRMRLIQEEVKKGNLRDTDYSIDDFLLIELLAWFKNEFFTWVDSPVCKYCGGQTYFAHMNEDPILMIHTGRVEMHKCHTCQQLTPFPRYNDVNILLITRSGRCGEWANTFTLLCCAMGWDARLVVDQGDHVWTEVYMHSQNKWLHCDPCENVCDTPLMYENGWGKKLSYVIAYSSEELQDVTWRYSSTHNALLPRRTLCSEYELIDALIKLRAKRQKNLSKPRVDYLTKRILSELVELMCEKQPTDKDHQGRTSGSTVWRLARGEIQPEIDSFTWVFKTRDTEHGNVVIQYSAALDRYEYLACDDFKDFRFGWNLGVFKSRDIFRKEEKDWKMVYLARTEGSDLGTLSWKFEVENPFQVIDTVDVKLEHKLYENGKVDITLSNDKSVINMPGNVEEFRTSAISGSKFVTVTVWLSGGRGNVAWQHAQVFRQEISSCTYPFVIEFSFKSIS